MAISIDTSDQIKCGMDRWKDEMVKNTLVNSFLPGGKQKNPRNSRKETYMNRVEIIFLGIITHEQLMKRH
jgi:hypothetical protein